MRIFWTRACTPPQDGDAGTPRPHGTIAAGLRRGSIVDETRGGYLGGPFDWSNAANAAGYIVWRHIYRGRVRWAIPNLLIESTPDRIVSLLVPGTVCKAPVDYGRVGYVQQLLRAEEPIGDYVWHTRRCLMIAPRDAAHTLGLHWDHASGDFLGWYVNLQEPMRPTAIGYDSFDQMLDVWIEPDGAWCWKDWDELVEAEQVGLFAHDEAEAIRAEGRRVIDSLNTLLPTGWEEWQPDPRWPLPALPEGWERA